MSDLSTTPTTDIDAAPQAKEIWKTTTEVGGVAVLIRLMYGTGYYLSISGSKGPCRGSMDVPIKGNGTYDRRMVVCAVGVHGRAVITSWREVGTKISFTMRCYWGLDITPWHHFGTFHPHGSRAFDASPEALSQAYDEVVQHLAIDEATPGAPPA